MPWVRLDDHFDEHPKIAAVGPLGVALYVTGLAYCNRNLTDGFVPANVAARLIDTAEPAEVIAALLEHGLWKTSKGGYRVHDYLDFQPPRARIIAERKAAKERMRKARDSRRSPELPPNFPRSSPEVPPKFGLGSPNPVPGREELDHREFSLPGTSPTTRDAAAPAPEGRAAAHPPAGKNGTERRPIADILADHVRAFATQYPDDALLDEFDRIERSRGERITNPEREQLLELAHTIRDAVT